MSDAMTLKEAKNTMRDRRSTTSEQFACRRATRDTAVEVLIAHAERTIAAREGEPHVLRELRDDMRRDQERLWASSHLDTLVAHIDTLTAQLAEARRERDTLAAIVQRVQGCAVHVLIDGVSLTVNGSKMSVSPGYEFFSAIDILAALTPKKPCPHPGETVRKIVQITVSSDSEREWSTLFALCNDGTVWRRPETTHDQGVWEQLPAIPPETP